jgi:hypothetical protein
MKLKPQERNLLWSANIWYLGDGMLGPLFAIFTQRIGGNILDITWAWALYLVITGVFTIVLGTYIDGKIDPRKIMIFGYFLSALATFGYLLVDTPIDLIIVQILLGLSNALTTPTWNSLYAKYSETTHSTQIWGLAAGYAYIITGIALVLGGIIVSATSFTMLFILMGVIKTIAAVSQTRLLFLRTHS